MTPVKMAAASFWRVKGISYLQYLSIGANVVRNSLKEPLRTEALKRSNVHYAVSNWTDGNPGPVGECTGREMGGRIQTERGKGMRDKNAKRERQRERERER